MMYKPLLPLSKYHLWCHATHNLFKPYFLALSFCLLLLFRASYCCLHSRYTSGKTLIVSFKCLFIFLASLFNKSLF
ncbi:hypothetical protein AB4K20DRAFT_1465543 [Rhizopus microsporus]